MPFDEDCWKVVDDDAKADDELVGLSTDANIELRRAMPRGGSFAIEVCVF